MASSHESFQRSECRLNCKLTEVSPKPERNATAGAGAGQTPNPERQAESRLTRHPSPVTPVVQEPRPSELPESPAFSNLSVGPTIRFHER